MHKNICKENNFKCNIFWKNLVNGYLNFDHAYRYFNINWKVINCNYLNKICIIMFSKWKANFFIAKFTNSYFYLKYEHAILYNIKNLLVVFVFFYFHLCSISIKKPFEEVIDAYALWTLLCNFYSTFVPYKQYSMIFGKIYCAWISAVYCHSKHQYSFW